MTKYRFNQTVFWICWTNLIAIIYFSQQTLNFIQSTGLFLWSFLVLYYLCNLIHLASHNLLARNVKLNHIFGWLSALPIFVFTFIDFKITHLEHHKHQGDQDLDPDYRIVKTGPVYLLPLRIIFYKDIFFWKYASEKKKPQMLWEYTIQRVFQAAYFGFIIYQNQMFHNWSLFIFYIIPLSIVGACNAAFLYYYPHYQNAFEHWCYTFHKARKGSKSKFNLFNPAFWLTSTFVWSVELSRAVHELHHKKPNGNIFYYPEFWLFKKN
jgi:fatty acid desaturase